MSLATSLRGLPLAIKILIPVIIVSGAWSGYIVYGWMNAENPDPNHTHADFAVYILGTKLDFAQEQYMTGESYDPSTWTGALGLRKNLHLHDGIGSVIHRHKPGLTFGDFLASISQTMNPTCLEIDDTQFALLDPGMKDSYALKPLLCDTGKFHWRMFVNGIAHAFDPAYDFVDGDKMLLTYGASDAYPEQEIEAISNDACLYSKTCPWRGKPPAENCIADPEVPCTVPLSEL